MTVSTHTYSAVLVGSPNVPLTLFEGAGTVTLDAGRAPHVQASIVVNPPGLTTLTALTPTQSPPPRVILTAAATFPAFSQSRTFNLSVRDWRVRQEDQRVELDLASDEALLGDFRALADDNTPLTVQSSLRSVVNYVLGVAIGGGAALAATPSVDANSTTLAASQNLIRNPRAAVDVTDYFSTWSTGGISVSRFATGGPTGAPTFARGFNGGTTTNGYLYYTDNAVSVSAGKAYVLSCWVRTTASVSLNVWMLDATPTIVGDTTPLPVVSGGAWVRVVQRFTTSPTTTKIRPRIVYPASMPAGTDVDWTGLRLSEETGDPADTGYFDGDTADTASYQYDWPTSGVPHATPSSRKPLVDAATPDALIWKAGQTALDFLHPIVQRFGLRLVCNEARVWTLRAADYTAPGALTVRYGVNMTEGEISISRDSELWFDARVTRYKWTTSDGTQYERVDAFTLNTPPTKVSFLEVESAYPGPGRSEYAVERAQGRGREVTVSMVSDWATHAEQQTTVTPDGFPIQIGISQSVRFSLPQDEMTITLRSIDTPVGAIDLLGGTINALAGTINGL